MRTLDQHVENNHERAYCNMINDAETSVIAMIGKLLNY